MLILGLWGGESDLPWITRQEPTHTLGDLSRHPPGKCSEDLNAQPLGQHPEAPTHWALLMMIMMMILLLLLMMILSIDRGRIQKLDRTEFKNGNIIKSLSSNENYKYLGILEADNILHTKVKELTEREYIFKKDCGKY